MPQRRAAGGATIRSKGKDYQVIEPELLDTKAARTEIRATFNLSDRVFIRMMGITQVMRLRLDPRDGDRRNLNSRMFAATVVLSGLLAFVFGGGAIGKLTKMRSQLDNANKLKISWPRYRLIAVPEAAAAVGLLAGLYVAPLGVAAAAGLVALMAGALSFRIRVRDATRSFSVTRRSWCWPASRSCCAP